MKIAVLFSDRSEMRKFYPNDWKGRETNSDAFSVIKALRKLGHRVSTYHVNLDLYEKLKKNRRNIDLVFNMCDDGFFVNPKLEPHVAAMLDVLHIPYTGSGYLGLALCLNKARAKKLLAYHRIPTPKLYVFRKSNEKIKKDIKFPLIVKPIHEDASIGIKDESVVYNKSQLKRQVVNILKRYNQPALVEEFIDGKEFNVGFIGEEILPIGEIIFDLPPDKPRIVNYYAKWKEDSIDYKGTDWECPANISKKLSKQLGDLALKAAKLLLCRDYFRVDFRLDKNNNPFILEVNPNPDISEDAGLPEMAKMAGYSYKIFIKKIVENASKRGKQIDK